LNASAKSSDRGESRRGKAHTKKSDASSKKIGELLKPGEHIAFVEVYLEITSKLKAAIDDRLDLIALALKKTLVKKSLPEEVLLATLIKPKGNFIISETLDKIKKYFLGIKLIPADPDFRLDIEGPEGKSLELVEQTIQGSVGILIDAKKMNKELGNSAKIFYAPKNIVLAEFTGSDTITPYSFKGALLISAWKIPPAIDNLKIDFHITSEIGGSSFTRHEIYRLKGDGTILHEISDGVYSV